MAARNWEKDNILSNKKVARNNGFFIISGFSPDTNVLATNNILEEAGVNEGKPGFF
jgi:hypothetical protein